MLVSWVHCNMIYFVLQALYENFTIYETIFIKIMYNTKLGEYIKTKLYLLYNK